MKKNRWRPWLLLAPSLSVLFFWLVIPLAFIIVYSFWLRAVTGADIPAFQLGNYAKFFADSFKLAEVKAIIDDVSAALRGGDHIGLRFNTEKSALGYNYNRRRHVNEYIFIEAFEAEV